MAIGPGRKSPGGEDAVMAAKQSVHFSSMSDSWSTPAALFRALDEEFRFNFDPCPLDESPNKSGGQLGFFDDVAIGQLERPKVDGLTAEWGSATFCNPPYSDLGAWIKKAFEEWKKGKTVVLLIPSRTDTKAWHDYVMQATEIRFVKGRLKFGDAVNSAPFPSAIVVFSSPSGK